MDTEISSKTGKDRNDITLGSHFNLREFACKCKKHCGGFTVFEPRLILGLLKLRSKLTILHEEGYIPTPKVILNCAVRCFKHNEEIGGVPGSEHLFQDGNGAADLRTSQYVLAPIEIGLLVWGQNLDDISKKFPRIPKVDRQFLAAKIEEFERIGIYGINAGEPGYHGKRDFIHVGIRKVGDLPARWGDWPHLESVYRVHPEIYKGRG